MPKLAQPIESKFSYQVEKLPLFGPNGQPTDSFGIFRTDNEKHIGTVRGQYGIVQNDDAVNAIEDGFRLNNMKTFQRKAIVMRGGAELAMQYDFPSRQIEVPKVGDVLALRVTLHNSFDGTSPLAFSVGFLRLICTNGMKTMQKEFALTKKHYEGLSLDKVRDQIKIAVSSVDKALELFGDMARVKLSQVQGNTILANLQADKILSKKLRGGIQSVWENPKYHEDRARTLYNVYNSATQYLTHNVETDRFELADRTGTQLVKAFALATHKPAELQRLLIPVPETAGDN